MDIVTNAYEDPRLNASLFALWDTVWGFLRAKEALAGRLGFPWREISTPFAAVVDGRVVAHVGLMGVPAAVGGTEITIGAIHAVCVAAELRGRGIGRTMIAAGLAEADRRGYPAVVLASEKVALYAKFGFRPRRIHWFVTRGSAGGGQARALDAARPGDAERWVTAMRTRAALSDRFAVLDRGAINAFDALNTDGSHAPLFVDEAVGAVYYARQEGARVVIDDVFAARPFDGERLLAGLPFACEEVAFGCDPGLLGLAARVEEIPYGPKDDQLQVRGTLVDEAVPVGWPAYSFC